MKPQIFFLLLINLPLSLFSQNENSGQSLDIHLNPMTLIDYTPRLRLGAEYTNASKFSYNCEIGFGNNALNSLRGSSKTSDYVFLEIRPELKYNLHRIKHLTFYTAIEGFVLSQNQTLQNSYYSKENTIGRTYFDRADFQKVKFGSHIKLGLRSLPFKRMTFDFYFGIGVARRIFDYSNVINPLYTNEGFFIEWIPQPYWFEGRTNLIHLTAGVKFGFLIWEK